MSALNRINDYQGTHQMINKLESGQYAVSSYVGGIILRTTRT